MVSTCPGCGAAVEFAPRSVRAVHGTCGACGGTFTIVEPSTVTNEPGPSPEPGEPGVVPGREAGETSQAPRGGPLPGPPCRHCGTPLVLRSWTADWAKAACPACGATVEYGTEPLPRVPRRPTVGGFAGRGRERRFPAPRGRPCRECGGPLTFSTDAAGVVTGACASCGNRFTLPPRPRQARQGPPGRTGRFSRGYSQRFQRPNGRFGDDEDRPSRRGPPRRTFRRRRGTEGDEETGFPGRRRRRSRED